MKFSHKRRLFAAALAASLLPLAAAPASAASEVYHPAYLSGFPDGSIRPEAALTREQLAQALYRLIPGSVRSGLRAQSVFSDVSADRWSYPAVSAAVELGILYGTADGAFLPEAAVSGPELAAALMRLSASDAAAEALPELARGWSALDVSFENDCGWVMGLNGTVFEPDAALTRAQFAEILNRLLSRTPQTLDGLLIGMPLWRDNLDTECWYFTVMQEAGTDHTAVCSGEDETWSGVG